MAYHYSDATREGVRRTLPDIETFADLACSRCSALGGERCGEGCDSPPRTLRHFAHFCLPGCLPDSDPLGPFDSEAEALAAAREAAGFCPHGIDAEEAQDDARDPCPHCAAPVLFAIVADGAANGLEGARFLYFSAAPFGAGARSCAAWGTYAHADATRVKLQSVGLLAEGAHVIRLPDALARAWGRK